jgi:uncharacterized protein (TIGR02118 family)
MFNAIILLSRREGVSPEEFRKWWLESHAPLACSLPALRGLRFNVVDGEDPQFDGVSELWFDTPEAFEEAYASPHGQRVAEDSLANVSRRERLFVTEHILQAHPFCPG